MDGDRDLRLNVPILVTWALRGLVAILIALLWAGIESRDEEIAALTASVHGLEREVITLQVERRSDVQRLESIDRKLEAIRQMLVTGEIRVVPTREGRNLE